MKKSKLISYKLVLIISFLPLLGLSQSKRKTIESFDVGANPELKLDVSHAEVKVTTWNKNRVEVKTTLSSEMLSEEEADELFDVHAVKVLGNSNRVEITSNADGEFRVANFLLSRSPTPPSPPTPPNLNTTGVPKPPKPPKPALEFDFDYSEFKEKGKAYIEKFKQQLDSTNFREEMKNFRKEMIKWKEQWAISRDSMLAYRTDLDSLRIYMKTFRSEAQDIFKRLNEDSGGSNPNASVKKVIELKVPESATFEVDLRHSKLDAESMKNLTARLKYSDLTVKTLSGEASELKLNYSNLEVDSADQLKLDLVYSKKVNVGNVNNLKVNSKMSELTVKNLKNQAFIQGSYGELTINEIHPKFSLIDIQLEKSSANLKLPENTSFNFYAKSSNSKFSINSGLDFKVTKSFDNVIYTNSATKTDIQRFSLNVDYSTITLN